ncbi:MAG: hypothetical protein ACR2PK_07155 [Acidimicrobiales bacterium]
MSRLRRGVYPGSFNPPTLGHLAIAQAAVAAHGLDQLDVVMSHQPLAKARVDRPSFEQRLTILELSVEQLRGVRALATEHRLIADIADGYDVVVMGADKWAQINDPAFYTSREHMADCLTRLPQLAVVARGSDPVPVGSRLEVAADIATISSTSARSGAIRYMTPEARASGLW